MAIRSGVGRAVFACSALLGTQAAGQQLDQAALDQIATTAASICGDFDRAGFQRSAGAEAAAEAELKGLIGRLLDLGVKGAAQIESQEYANVLQDQLGEELRDNRACRLKIWSDLVATVAAASPRDGAAAGQGSGGAPPGDGAGGGGRPADPELPGGILFGEVARGPFLYCVVYNPDAAPIVVGATSFGFRQHKPFSEQIWVYETAEVPCEANCEIAAGAGSSFAGPPNDPLISDPVCSVSFRRQ